MPTAPDYVPAHGLLADRGVVVTAAAGTGIGSAVARRALEEGARPHQRRARAPAGRGRRCVGRADGQPPVHAALRRHLGGPGAGPRRRRARAAGRHRRLGEQRGPRRHRDAGRDGRRAVVEGHRRHAHRDHAVHAGGAGPDDRARVGRDRQQRLGGRLAGPGRPVPLRRGQGRGDGAHPLRGDRGGAGRRPDQRRRAEPRHAPVPLEGHDRRAAGRADRARSVRPLRRAVGGGERHRVPGQRLLVVHDRRGRASPPPP